MQELDVKQQLMVITMEECGELQQVCSKILRRAKIDEEYGTKLVEELGDVYCMLRLMVEHNICNWAELEEQASVKRNKLAKWSDLTK